MVDKFIANNQELLSRSITEIKQAIRNCDLFIKADKWGVTSSKESEEAIYDVIIEELTKDRR